MIHILIDVHCHTNLYLDLSNIIEDALRVGVKKIIGVAMSSMSQQRILEIASRYKEIFAALGIHPEEVKANSNIQYEMDETVKFIIKNKQYICAIGEIGLDHHFVKDKELYPLQKQIFDEMLKIAQDLQLPVNLHTKGAEKQVFETLPSFNIPNVNIHWYSGPEEYLKIGMDRGYYFSLTPAIKYSPAVKKTALMVDKEHLLLESDGPVKYSGVIATPSMLVDVLEITSNIKKIALKELETQIEENTRMIFPNIF
ncbi:MAG: TatD family hydrolase [Candidatus Thorarchaeota archaeon]